MGTPVQQYPVFPENVEVNFKGLTVEAVKDFKNVIIFFSLLWFCGKLFSIVTKVKLQNKLVIKSVILEINFGLDLIKRLVILTLLNFIDIGQTMGDSSM